MGYIDFVAFEREMDLWIDREQGGGGSGGGVGEVEFGCYCYGNSSGCYAPGRVFFFFFYRCCSN